MPEKILITPAAWDMWLHDDGEKQQPSGLEYYWSPDQQTKLVITTELREDFEMECNRNLAADILTQGEWDHFIAWCQGDAGEENANAPLFDVTEYEKKIERERRTTSPYRHNAAKNAALISSEVDYKSISPLTSNDEIAKAALILDDIEAGFDEDIWADTEGKYCDWETVCARIAAYISENRKAPDKQTIIEFIKDNA